MAALVTAERAEARPAKARIRVSPWHAIALIAIALACVFPFYWMVTTSLKDQAVALASPPAWLFEPTLDHYRAVLGPKDVGPAC